MRPKEHKLRTWDVGVALDPAATLSPQVVELIVDNLTMIARYTGKPTGATTAITVATTHPQRSFTINLKPDSVTFGPSTGAVPADVEPPGEALARLAYGRLDPEHTPPGDHGPALDTLRRVFPGP